MLLLGLTHLPTLQRRAAGDGNKDAQYSHTDHYHLNGKSVPVTKECWVDLSLPMQTRMGRDVAERGEKVVQCKHKEK